MAVAYKVAANSHPGRRIKGVVFDELPKTNPWEPYRLKLFPKKINERWYKPGDVVYRMRAFGPGGVHWQYGDEFDYLKWQ
jgi:hypothetical protein